ncbi:hypothetical protein D3C81_1136370 [compost metagenome]
MRAGAGDAAAQQLLQQGIAHGLRTHLHAGGVDDVLHVQLERMTTLVERGELDAGAIGERGFQAAPVQLQLPLLLQFHQLRVHRGGNPVTVHVPVAHHMPQETALVIEGQRLPQRLPHRADALHHVLPRNAALGGLRRVLSQRTQALAQIHLQQRLGVVVGRRPLGVRQRQQRMARQHMDAPAMAGRHQRHHGVGHAQAGTHDGHVSIGGDAMHRIEIPGFHALAVRQRAGATRGQRTQRIARRQHHATRQQLLARSQRQLETGSVRVQCLHTLGTDLQLCGARLHRLLQAMTQVVGKVAARHELRCQRVAINAREGLHIQQVIEEILDLVGEAAHLAGRHVEQVFGIGGGIGHAACQGQRRLQDQHTQWLLRTAQQANGSQDAGSTAADDGHITRPGVINHAHWPDCRRCRVIT